MAKTTITNTEAPTIIADCIRFAAAHGYVDPVWPTATDLEELAERMDKTKFGTA